MIRTLLVLLLGWHGTVNATNGEEAPSASPSESLTTEPSAQPEDQGESFRVSAPPGSIRFLMHCVGRKVASREFELLSETYQLKRREVREDLSISPKENFMVRSVRETFIGPGLLVYGHMQETVDPKTRAPLPQFTKMAGVAELKVSAIELILAECRESIRHGLWTGELPIPDMPRTPESLRMRFPEIQSDETEETFINRKGGTRYPFGSTRRITYANRWNSIDRFPFSFEFRGDSLVLLKIHPAYNDVITIWPKLPEAPPVGEPK
ncbi:MAG: hypothetical protein ACKV19_24815 [Verrucomicrobiales bacterium]